MRQPAPAISHVSPSGRLGLLLLLLGLLLAMVLKLAPAFRDPVLGLTYRDALALVAATPAARSGEPAGVRPEPRALRPGPGRLPAAPTAP